MSNKTRIQGYLVKNKISELFEEMMAKLVHDLPANPVLYLSELLQKKAQLKKKLLDTKPLFAQTTPVYSKSSTTNLWSSAENKEASPVKQNSPIKGETPPSSATKSRHYNKPWLTNSSKKPKDLAQSMPARGFTGDKTLKSSQDLSRSMNAGGDTVVDGARDVDLRLVYAKPKIFGEMPEQEENEDAELSVVKDEKKKKDKKSKKKKKAKTQEEMKEKRKKKLRKMLDSNKNDSAAKDENDNDIIESEDEAIEICEDLDDLREEGVKNPPRTGVHTSSNSNKRKEEIELVLNMSKFFDSLGGAVVPSSEEKAQTHLEVDEDFESASQVTGPRHPVWETPQSEVDSTVSQNLATARQQRGGVFDITNSSVERPRSQLSHHSKTSRNRPTDTAANAASKAAEERKTKIMSSPQPSPTKSKRGPKSATGEEGRIRSPASNRGSLSHRSNRSSVDRPKTAQ